MHAKGDDGGGTEEGNGSDSEEALEGLLRLRCLGTSNTALMAVVMLNCATTGNLIAAVGMALLFAASAQFVLSRRSALAERNDRALLMVLTGPCMNLILFLTRPGFNILRTKWMVLIFFHALLCSVGFSLPPMHSLVHVTFSAATFGFFECHKVCQLAAHQQHHQHSSQPHLGASPGGSCLRLQLLVLVKLIPATLAALTVAAAVYTSARPSHHGFNKSLPQQPPQVNQRKAGSGCATPGSAEVFLEPAAEPAAEAAVPLEAMGLHVFSSLRLLPLLRRYHAFIMSETFVKNSQHLLKLVGIPLALYYAWAVQIARMKAAPLDDYVSPEGLLMCMLWNFVIGGESSKLDLRGVFKHVQHQLVASQSLLMDQLPAHIVRAALSRMSMGYHRGPEMGQEQEQEQCTQQHLQQLQEEDEEQQDEGEGEDEAEVAKEQEQEGECSKEDDQDSDRMCAMRAETVQQRPARQSLPSGTGPQSASRSDTCPRLPDPFSFQESQSEQNSMDTSLGLWLLPDTQQSLVDTARTSRNKPTRRPSACGLRNRRHSFSTPCQDVRCAVKIDNAATSHVLQSKPALPPPASMSQVVASYLLRATNASRGLNFGLRAAGPAQPGTSSAGSRGHTPRGPAPGGTFTAVDRMERDVFIANHESVTLYVSDICGFSSWSGKVEPSKVLQTIDALYTRLDDVILKEFPTLYKIETVGDAYIVAANMLLPDPDHAATAVRFAVRAQEEASKVPRPDVDDGSTLQMRIGLHSGSISSGIVGKIRRRYVVYGDAMNLASRTETTCPPGCIQLTAATYTLAAPALDSSIALTRRGEVQIKGREEPVLMYMADRSDRPSTAVLGIGTSLGSQALSTREASVPGGSSCSPAVSGTLPELASGNIL